MMPVRHLSIDTVWSGAISPWYNRSVPHAGFVVATNKRSLQVLDPSRGWRVLADLPTPGIARGLALDPPLVHLVDGPGGLSIYDLTQPTQPRLLSGQCHAGSDLRGITLRGDYAYCAAWNFGFEVIDVTDPECPLLVTQIETRGDTRASAFYGDWLYITEADEGVGIYDASNAPELVEVGRTTAVGRAWDLEIQNDRLFVADGPQGLAIYDLGMPALPVEVGRALTPEVAYSVSVMGNTAYVSSGRGGLVVVDVNPASLPTVIDQVQVDGGLARHFALAGDRGYASVSDAGLREFDLSNPQAPVQIGGIVQELSHARGLALTAAGNLAAAMRHAGVLILDLSIPESPETIAELTLPSPAAQAYAVAASGDTLFVAWGVDGIQAYDLRVPDDPQLVAESTHPGNHRTLTLADELVSANASGGLLILYRRSDLSHLGTWVADQVDSFGPAARDGDELWVPAGATGLIRLDISDPSQPASVDTIFFDNESSSIEGVLITENLLLVTDQAGPVHAVRRADLALLDSYFTVGDPAHLGWFGPLPAVTLHGMGLLLLDVREPSRLRPVLRFDTSCAVFDFALAQGVLYTADDWEIGAARIDLSP